MYGYIYKTTCLINNLIYVGQHKAAKFEPNKYIGSGRLFLREVKKFGKENFICELLDTAENLDELNSKEEYWVEFYQSRDPLIGYNVKKGGEQLGLTGCCKIKRGEETLVVERASVKPYIDDGWCLTNTEEIRKQKKKLQHKKWYQKNKYKVAEKNKAWREAHNTVEDRVKRKLYDHNHYLVNKEKYLQKAKEWQKENKEKRQESATRYKKKKYQTDPEFRAKMRESSRKYRKVHREELLKKQRERRRLEKEMKKR